jgi:hypothetical protein
MEEDFGMNNNGAYSRERIFFRLRTFKQRWLTMESWRSWLRSTFTKEKSKEWWHNKVNPWFNRRTWKAMLNTKVNTRRTKFVPSMIVSLVVFAIVCALAFHYFASDKLDEETMKSTEKILLKTDQDVIYEFVPWDYGVKDPSRNIADRELANGNFSVDPVNPLSNVINIVALSRSMETLARREGIDCVCARELGIHRKILTYKVDSTEGFFDTAYNCIEYTHDHHKGMSKVVVENKFLFPGRSPVPIVRHNSLSLSCVDKTGDTTIVHFEKNPLSWCVQTCIDLDKPLTIYDQSL